ncbi:MAG: carbohydrate binding family 9 domain-containing protein [Armatimonadetes bacterium]|nr:carbohydrate binding family 9 domain-containing protein [Armatimonadota bacterium]MDE2208055.1 carbohydrate binding family 9 domain-containing protein [Armatimonadota bacterium]
MHNSNTRFITAVLLVVAPPTVYGSPASAQANGSRHIAAVRTATPPVIDGDLSDPCWKSAPTARMFTDEQNDRPAPDQTVAMVVYDSRCIYVAFRCTDNQPASITARETVRDSKYQNQNNGSYDTEDNVEVRLDPFLSHRDSDISRFSVNAIGTPSALLGGGRAAKVEWEGLWQAAVKRTPTGWQAEFRIPWRILNYPKSNKPIDFGINFTRFQTRTALLSEWSNLGPQVFTAREGIWTGVVPPAGRFKPRLSLLPYLLPAERAGAMSLRIGMDARYPISPQLTAVAALNPDFGTVEGAVQGIQFSHSELFLQDQRPFFVEGNELFGNNNFNLIGNYFYSQRIPGFILGGKVYGNVTHSDTLVALETETPGSRSDLATRIRHDFSPTANLALTLVQRTAPGDNNTVGLLEHDQRWGKLEADTQLGISGGNTAGGHSFQTFEVYEDKLNTTGIGLTDVAPDFVDEDGYVPFNDERSVVLFENWAAAWRHGPWRSFNVQSIPQFGWHYSGAPYQRGIDTAFQFVTQSNWQLGGEINYDKFDTQTDATMMLSVTRGVLDRFHTWGISILHGLQGSRPSTFVQPSFSYRFLHKLDITYAGALLYRDGRTQQHVVSLNYQVSPTVAFGGRLVAQTGGTNGFLFYRHSGGKGTETYIILGDPNAQRWTNLVAVKLVFAL